VRDWKAFKPTLPKAPSIFLFGQTIWEEIRPFNNQINSYFCGS
jgi:hypothetical protein